MSEEYKSPVFKKWLDALQQESWQLELIISGFALYALFSSFEPVSMETRRAIAQENSLHIYFMTFLVASLFILILNLTAHVILRGLWIGAIGLRYVSGEIDYEELKYTLKFRNHLEDKVGSFDKFIADLEKYCSVIFASTFLTVFYILAFFIIFGLLFLSTQLINTVENSVLRTSLIILSWLTIGLGIIMTMVDFITQGWLKRNRWLSRIYFPYYRLFSLITLSFIYRPIVYNLLDNKFGRRLVRFLLPVYFIILMITSLDKVNSNYIPADFEDPFFGLERLEQIATPVNYEDELGEEKFARIISIPSKIVETPYLAIFVPFSERIENVLFERYPELVPERDRRGVSTSFFKLNLQNDREKREGLQKYLSCFSKEYTIQLDDQVMAPEFIISQNLKEQSGFETVIRISFLPEGRHVLTFSRKGDEDAPVILARIPFWYMPE